jgi:hypothetical protein
MNLLRFLGVFFIPTCAFAQVPDMYASAPKKPVSPIYGKWKSKEDEKVVYDFLPSGKVVQYYDGQKMTEERIDTYADCAKAPCTDTMPKTKQPHKTAVKRLEKNSCFTLKGRFEANCYKIIRLDNAVFQYAQMGTSTKFSFVRVRADEKPAVVKVKEPVLVPEKNQKPTPPPTPIQSKQDTMVVKMEILQDSIQAKPKIGQDTVLPKMAKDSVKVKMPSKSKPKNKKS